MGVIAAPYFTDYREARYSKVCKVLDVTVMGGPHEYIDRHGQGRFLETSCTSKNLALLRKC